MRITDWDDAYANMAHVPDGESWPGRWAAAAAEFKSQQAPRTIGYGAHPRERFDLFAPAGAPRGLAVFVHGGYWRAFDRGDFSHLAAGALARGWAVALPGYVIAPEGGRVAGMTRQIAAAITAAAGEVAGPIRLAGHSAGGHLVTRQVCTDTGLPAPVLDRVEAVLSISGVHDLRPLLRTAVGVEARLDPAEAEAESPALRQPVEGARVHVRVGGEERPEFLRQSALLANVWTGLGADMSQTVAPGRHHFDVIGPLTEAESDLVAAFVGE